MPRGKKELAEQIIPYAASVEVEVGRGKTFAETVKKIGVTERLKSCPRPTVLFVRIVAQKKRKNSAADFTIVSGNPFLSAVVTLHVHCPLPTPPKSRRDCCQL